MANPDKRKPVQTVKSEPVIKMLEKATFIDYSRHFVKTGKRKNTPYNGDKPATRSIRSEIIRPINITKQ